MTARRRRPKATKAAAATKQTRATAPTTTAVTVVEFDEDDDVDPLLVGFEAPNILLMSADTEITGDGSDDDDDEDDDEPEEVTAVSAWGCDCWLSDGATLAGNPGAIWPS